MISLKSLSHGNTLKTSEQRLRAHPALVGTPIHLTKQGDALQLSGEVATHYQKHLAQRLLRDLYGFRVVNDLEIKRTSLSPLLVKRLYQNSLRRRALPDISARVEGRTIHLSGQVTSWREREQAEQLALTLPSIHTVINTIRLESE